MPESSKIARYPSWVRRALLIVAVPLIAWDALASAAHAAKLHGSHALTNGSKRLKREWKRAGQ